MSDACCRLRIVVDQNCSDIPHETMKEVKNILNGPENMAVISAPLNIEASDSRSQNKWVLNLIRPFRRV